MRVDLATPLLAWIPGVKTWIVVWTVLSIATVVIVLLMRSRWRDVKPWKKCALLSAWVHVLLACLATNVRIGVSTSGGPGIGPGEGGPIRVAVIGVDMEMLEALAAEPPRGETDAPITTEVPVPEPKVASEELEPLPTFVMPQASDGEEAVEPRPAKPESTEPPPAADAVVIAGEPKAPAPATLPEADVSLAAPDLLPQPEPEPEPAEEPQVAEADDKAEDEKSDAPPAQLVAKTDGDATAPPAPQSGSPPAPTRGTPDGNPNSKSGPRNVPGEYAGRFADRDAMVAGGGGNPTTERAVRSALAWLAASQDADGHWDPKKFGAGQERYVLGENRGGAGARADTGITALALLAFLGAGHTHLDGPYADNVARGLDYLRRSQSPNGNLGGQAELFAHMYCHSMASFAVSEACALTDDEKLKPIVQKAIGYTLAVQHPTDGGWRYRPGDTGDTSQLGWQLMALKSAELAGFDVPDVTWTRVERFLRSVERGADGGLAAYRPEGPPTRAMTAESLFCRQLITRARDGGLKPAAIDEARRSLLEEQPGSPMINYYYWYYATIALHRAKDATPASAEAWTEWNDALTGTLVDSQSGDGSWPAACLWGGYGGRVYTTALATMCLEVYYRYVPEEAPDLARRDEWQTLPAK